MKNIIHNLDCSKNTFKLVVLGDMHLGDHLCDLGLIKKTINFINETPDCYVILNGDLINNGLKTSKSDSYLETMSMEEEQDLLIDLLTPIKSRILAIASGNHEYRTTLLAGINPLRYVARALGLLDVFVDNSYIITIEFGTAYDNKKVKNKYIIYGIHGGSGGGRRAGSTVNALEDMTKIVANADLYVHSHTHTTANFADKIIIYDRALKREVLHTRTFYNTNAFLIYGGYAEQKGFKLVDSTPSIIVVQAIRTKDNTMKLTTNIIKI